jgi:hypothetical protein
MYNLRAFCLFTFLSLGIIAPIGHPACNLLPLAALKSGKIVDLDTGLFDRDDKFVGLWVHAN